ncbi:uncharacterized protein LOC142517817 [Primulina tabacum]|uniref:uncharacterized protein LOC142517817 n=1 Tax=Primulina tabacum TaxID=48773 RepID=UPI003F5A5C10
MVKLASAREIRMYGPRRARNRSEYINASLYVFATIVLGCGFGSQWTSEARSGLVLAMVGLVIIVLVNVHDLVAHLAGIDYRLSLMEFDLQLALVEFAGPLIFAVGTLLFSLATFFLFIQAEKGYGLYKLEQHALNMLIAGPVLWLLGSIQNSCQIYERADGTVQILQESVHIPFMMASLLFLVGGILNSREQIGYDHHGVDLLGESWIWLCISGSILLFLGGVANVLKVFEMLHGSEPRLEKLRGGARERLLRIREGRVPLIREEQQRQQRPIARDEGQPRERQVPQVREEQRGQQRPAAMEEGQSGFAPTPYKDVLVG